MGYENLGALDASIQQKIDSDTDFQTTLADLSDEDKESAIKVKKSELVDEEIKTLSLGKEKSDELADNYKTRAEKAEADNKKNKPTGDGNSQNPDALSTLDTIAITKADVHEDDIQEVIDYAKFKKISVSEALKSDVVKTTLAHNSEIRKSAETANTRPARPSASKPSDQQIVEDTFEKGKIPEAGTPEAEQLFWAKRKKK